jgi:predicted DNA-binding transcriptional regulator AlpA
VTILYRLESLNSLPTGSLVSAKELSLLASRSRASLWRDVREGRLPQPIAIGPQTRRWRIEDVRAYLKGEGA